ncbi:MAG: hypothetical protein JWM55_1904 [Acidimicrobiaceae bacterium]|nr:hypothetical protein [Acidimicrobiaceae bacterium]
MSHRFTTWWRALSVVLLSLATVTWPSAARADTTSTFVVVHQNAVAALSARGVSRFTTTLRLAASPRTHVSVTLYPALVTQGALQAIVNGDDATTQPLSTTRFDLNCERGGEATFSVTLHTRALASPPRTCNGATPALRLICGASCAGVYPLRYRVDVNGTVAEKWSLIAVQTSDVNQPLNVSLIETLSPKTLSHATRSLAVLNTFGRFASSPLTLGADYQTLADIQLNETSDVKWVSALTKALASPLHRAIDAPPRSTDFTGLAAHHLTTQIGEQLTLSQQILTALTGRYVDAPVLLSGPQAAAGLFEFARLGIGDVVLPESDLSVAPSTTLTWGAPFHVVGAGSLTALNVDGPLSSLVGDASIEPGRRAAMTLAWLAFLHFEAPNDPSTRDVVLETSVDSSSSTFVDDLLSGFAGNPFSRLAPLSPLFDSSLIGTDGAPVDRSLNAPSVVSTWSSHNVSSLLALISGVTSYEQGVKSGDIATALHVAVAQSEELGTPDKRQGAIDAAQNLLNDQLKLFSVNASAITLAGPGTSLPVTIISHAPYSVDAVVHLVTNGVSFPKGSSFPISMTSPTQSLRVPTSNPQGSSLTLQVILTTPNDQIVLARTAIQVRIAGTSVVGYLLTFASLLVLALWWWRTHRRRSRGRHAR